MPHGNDSQPEALRADLRAFRGSSAYRARPRPVLINEDSVVVESLDVALSEYASWGFYCQGYGSAYKDLMDWTTQDREGRYEYLSGYQTLPVNWSINTPVKKAGKAVLGKFRQHKLVGCGGRHGRCLHRPAEKARRTDDLAMGSTLRVGRVGEQGIVVTHSAAKPLNRPSFHLQHHRFPGIADQCFHTFRDHRISCHFINLHRYLN